MSQKSPFSSNPADGHIANLVAGDGTVLLTRKWTGGRGTPTLFIGHSQPTHSGHFGPLARSLNGRGWTVCSGDLRGHGHSTGPGQPLVHLTAEKGWNALIEDMQLLLENAFQHVAFANRIIAAQNITALLTLEVLKRNPDLAGHLVLTLPANQPTVAKLARTFARARMAFKPDNVPDDQTHHHLYSFLGARLRERRHLADVMSADRALVDEIVADPLGFAVPTLGYWSEIFSGMERAWDWPDGVAINPQTKVLLLYGEEDPLIANGKLVAPVRQWFSAAGVKKVDVAVVEGGRTAILLDERSLDVSSHIVDWIEGEASYPAQSDLPQESFETISAQVLERFANEEEGTSLDTEALIALCYEAVDDETRWIELLYRVALHMARNERTDPVDLDTTLNSLMPHWDRSYSINKRIQSSTALGMILQTVIEKLDIGTALLSARQSVLHHNEAFRDALTYACTGAGLTSGNSIDADLSGVMDDEFRSQIASAQDTCILSISGHPIGFYFRPDVLKALWDSDGAPAGLLVLRSPDSDGRSRDDTRISMLILAYGLTRQEATVVLHVTQGLGPAAVSERLSVSINTIRTHLKRAYEKMDVDGQTEMVARIMGGPIGWLSR